MTVTAILTVIAHHTFNMKMAVNSAVVALITDFEVINKDPKADMEVLQEMEFVKKKHENIRLGP
jgi:hypothetical protein